MLNSYAQLQRLVQGQPLQYATVISSASASSVVQLPGGAQIRVRGAATVSAAVFVRGDVIESDAPSLPVFTDVI